MKYLERSLFTPRKGFSNRQDMKNIAGSRGTVPLLPYRSTLAIKPQILSDSVPGVALTGTEAITLLGIADPHRYVPT